MDNNKYDVPNALFNATGKIIAIDSIREWKKQEIILKAMEYRAIQVLEAVRQVLDSDIYDDPECFERVDALVMLFFQELEVKIDRHDELE